MSLTTTVKAPGADGATFTFTTPFDPFASNAMDILKAHNDSVQTYVKSMAAKDAVDKAVPVLEDDEGVFEFDRDHGWTTGNTKKSVAESWGKLDACKLDACTPEPSEGGSWEGSRTPKLSSRTSEKSQAVDLNHNPDAHSSKESSIKIHFYNTGTEEDVSIWFKRGDSASKLREKYATVCDVSPDAFTLTWEDSSIPVDYVLGECIWGSMPGIDSGAHITVFPNAVDGVDPWA